MRLRTAVLALSFASAAVPATAQSPSADRTLRPFGSAEALGRHLDSVAAAIAAEDAEDGSTTRIWLGGPLPGVRPEVVHGAVPDSLVVIAGVVRDAASGRPLSHADVRISRAARPVTTSQDGTYRVVVPAVRPFTTVPLTVNILGYLIRRHTLILQPGDSMRADVSLGVSSGMDIEIFLGTRPGDAAGTPLGEVEGAPRDGVDVGGAVKLHGEHLVILRGGRLFTVAVGGGALRPVAAVDARAPGTAPAAASAELLVWGDRAVVLGHGDAHTEIHLFRIGRDGRLRYESTHHLRADRDEAPRHAARLVGHTLVLHTVQLVDPREAIEASLPALRSWRPGMRGAVDFRPLVSAADIFHPGHAPAADRWMALHTLTSCDLSRRDPECRATTLLGPSRYRAHVSPTAVYVWPDELPGKAITLYRMPLSGAAPTALRVAGRPWDERSLLEDGGDLHVVVHGEKSGMPTLLRVPLSAFGDGSAAAPATAYRALPVPDGDVFYPGRFVGGSFLYPTGPSWGSRERGTRATLHAVPLRGGDASALPLPYGVDRIEAMGRGALAVGGLDGELRFTRLSLAPLRAAGSLVHPGASWGNTRTPGWSYHVDGPDAGTYGIPLRPEDGRESTRVVFVRNDGGEPRPVGELTASIPPCRESCQDNARALFLRGRVFALLGGEIVEGEMRDGQLRELRRVRFDERGPPDARP